MRDAEKLRDKVELRLDDRQIAALAVAVLLLLGGVFSLGLMVGKTLSSRAPQPLPAGDLAALDAQQKREAAIPAAPAAATPKPVVAPRPVDPPPPGPAREVEVHAATPVSIAPPPERKALVVDPPKPVTVDPPAHPSFAPPPRELGTYTVQIGSSTDRTEAMRLVTRARAAGLKPYVMEAHLGAKGTWYRVRVGSFEDKDAATRYRKDVERELRATAVVMPTTR